METKMEREVTAKPVTEGNAKKRNELANSRE